jgi:hypothetical protein
MKCKTCGAELQEVGYPKDFWQYYKCPNGCEEIFTTRDMIIDKIGCAIAIVVLFCAVILSLPLYLWSKIAKWLE